MKRFVYTGRFIDWVCLDVCSENFNTPDCCLGREFLFGRAKAGLVYLEFLCNICLFLIASVFISLSCST